MVTIPSSWAISNASGVTSAGEALPPELYRRWMTGPAVEILDGAQQNPLERNLAIAQAVPGMMDGAHPTMPDQTQQMIASV